MTTTTTTNSIGKDAVTAGPAAAPALAGLVIASAVTLSAFLLFQVQPLVAKYILPWFGGGAGVWTTCMIFFQIALLVGYLYAHLSVTYLAPRAQGLVHALLVVLALAMLPIIPAERWKPIDPAADPSPRILLLLLATLGAPYVVLSATAPLLQAWFARLFPGRSPYRLYALSNAASLAALLSFPFVIEPLLSRRAQAYAWSGGYVVLAACLAACVAFLWMGHRRGVPGGVPTAPRADEAEHAATRTTPIHYALWLLLPACSSAMFLAVTNKLSLDIAAIPFLWIVPLAIYLLSFIICFDSPRWYRRSVFGPLLVVSLAASCYALLTYYDWGAAAKIASLCLALFACCMVCHGELVALKPDPRRLTLFYLLIAAGGALGGVSVGLVAPLVFDEFLELQIGLVVTWVLFMVALAANGRSALYRFRRAPAWYVMFMIGALLVAALFGPVAVRRAETSTIEQTRNFYGVINVHEWASESASFVVLLHNGITHGIQERDPVRRRELTSYYRPSSGIGRVLLGSFATRPVRVGAVGLGAGTLAAAGKPGDVIRFYEIDPDVERIAREHFTHLADSRATVEVAMGDARLSMEREPPQAYDVLALDAFSGDGIPYHLMTREVMETYLRHLKPDGVIGFHITNRHLDLAPVVEGLARHFGHQTVYVDDNGKSMWALVAKNPSSLDAVRPFATPGAVPKSARLWTDDHASLLPILRWTRRW